MHDPRAIANKFISIGINNGNPLTLIQIMKLSYISHGFCLATLDHPLSSKEPEAWKYGPVFPDIYHSLKFNGIEPITNLIAKIKFNYDKLLVPIDEKFSSEENEIIEFVYKHYGHLNGLQISAITHKDGTPWKEV